jgi:hypothetical protein
MPDTTAVTLTVHAVPGHEVGIVCRLAAEHGLMDDDGDQGVIVLGEAYSAGDIRCGTADELAGQLVDRAPGTAFTVYEEPAYEWMGTVVTYVPGLELPPDRDGRPREGVVCWGASCDADGNGVWTAEQIREAIAAGPEHLAVMLGEPWDAAIGAMPTGERIVKQPTREVEWDRTTGEFTILAGDDPAAVDAVLLGVTAAPAMTDADKQRGTAALAEQGWWAVEPWTRVDARGRFWSTEAVRLPSTPEPGKGER